MTPLRYRGTFFFSGIWISFIAFRAWNTTQLHKNFQQVNASRHETKQSPNSLSQPIPKDNDERTSGDAVSISPIMDMTSSRLCNREDIINGRWVPTIMEQPPYVSKNSFLRCYPDEMYNKTWHTYRWQPEKQCEFNEWNTTELCTRMHRGTILVAGDSLSWEQFSSLGQLLGTRIHQSSQHTSKEEQSNFVTHGCNHQTRLVFRRDDILRNLTSAIKGAFPQVIILNRGAHYQNDTKLMNGIEENIEEIKMWLGACDLAGIKCHFFWRTTVPGHPRCDEIKFDEPNNDLDAMEQWIADRSNYNERSINYHWFDYQRQNQLVIDAFARELGEDSFEVLDAYYLNIRRPDEHRAHQGDCLHNCYPGKMDVYNQLLLHYLIRDRSQEDVKDLLAFQDRMMESRASKNQAQQA